MSRGRNGGAGAPPWKLRFPIVECGEGIASALLEAVT